MVDDICVIVVEEVQKLSCCVFIVEQGQATIEIFTVSKANRKASVVVKDPFLLKINKFYGCMILGLFSKALTALSLFSLQRQDQPFQMSKVVFHIGNKR